MERRMKMVFFSSDRLEMEQVERGLVDAGIPCLTRTGPMPEGYFPSASYAELWIQDDHDWQRALLVCVGHGIGLGKRAKRKGVLSTEEQR